MVPTASTSPASSRPRISDSPNGGGYWPRRCNVSARFRAEARTRTSNCSGRGVGSGTSVSCSTSGPPGVVKVIARMLACLQVEWAVVSARHCSKLPPRSHGSLHQHARDQEEHMAVPQRIVSLLPSSTEILCALGLEGSLVGLSHACDYPSAVTS